MKNSQHRILHYPLTAGKEPPSFSILDYLSAISSLCNNASCFTSLWNLGITWLGRTREENKMINSWDERGMERWVAASNANSIQFSCSVVSDSLQPHESQHARPPCPSPTPGAYSNSYPSRQRCHPTISSSVVSFSSRLQSFPASESFPMSQFFTSGGQIIGVSGSTTVLPMNIQDWFPLGWTGWISLLEEQNYCSTRQGFDLEKAAEIFFFWFF